MKEKDYNKWLKAKSEIEHFDELDDNLKEIIFNIEQDFEDEWEVELEYIDLERKELNFLWIGYEKDLEMLKEEFGYTDEEAEEGADISHETLMICLEDNLKGIDWSYSAGE